MRGIQRGGVLWSWGRPLAALAAAAYAVSLFVATDSALAHVVHEVVPILVPLAAGVACLGAAARSSSRSRLAWGCFAAGAISWAAGDTAYSVLELLHIDVVGSLTWADAGYLALIPLWFAALVVHPSQPGWVEYRVGTLLDAAAMVVVAAVFTFVHVLQPALTQVDDPAGAVALLAYPLGDLALLAAYGSLVVRAEQGLRGTEALIGLAIVALGVGDVTFAHLGLTDAYVPGTPVDLTWNVAFAAMFFAARRLLAEPAGAPARRWTVPFLPGLALAGVAALALAALAGDSRRNDFLVGAIAAGVIVAARQVVLIVDNRRLVQALHAHVEELAADVQRKEKAVTAISHDLRAPLVAIKGFVNLLRRPENASAPDRVIEWAAIIDRNTERVSRMVEDLLCAGQFAAGRTPSMAMERTDLAEVARECVGDLGVDDRVVVRGDCVEAIVDRTRMHQVLSNLVGNALRFSPSGEKVTVTVDRQGSFARVEVTDAGRGIEAERLERIFQPFVGDPRSQGAGLGLYIVRGLVEAMGGRVGVRSELGRGSTFVATVPAAS